MNDTSKNAAFSFPKLLYKWPSPPVCLSSRCWNVKGQANYYFWDKTFKQVLCLLHILAFHLSDVENIGGFRTSRSIRCKGPRPLSHWLGNSCLSKNLWILMFLKIFYFKIQMSVLGEPLHVSGLFVIPVRETPTLTSRILYGQQNEHLVDNLNLYTKWSLYSYYVLIYWKIITWYIVFVINSVSQRLHILLFFILIF